MHRAPLWRPEVTDGSTSGCAGVSGADGVPQGADDESTSRPSLRVAAVCLAVAAVAMAVAVWLAVEVRGLVGPVRWVAVIGGMFALDRASSRWPALDRLRGLVLGAYLVTGVVLYLVLR